MNFESAKSMFMEFMALATDGDKQEFILWLKEDVLPEFETQNGEGLLEGTVSINKIAADIRTRMPQEAVLPSENIVFPTLGEDSCLSSTNSVHVDAFLYDEAAEEQLVEEGSLQRSYCKDCGSRNIEDLTFITHSCSKERLEYIFSGLLPPLKGKTVIDIGSRIGAVLYGAFYYSEAKKIIGVEINSDLCKLQTEIVQSFKLSDRISVVEGDMCTMADLISSGDVIILNNVFDWFMSPDLQITMWKFLRASLRPGSLLVTIPSLETSLEHLDTGIDLEDWVSLMPMHNKDWSDNGVETSEICLYKINSSGNSPTKRSIESCCDEQVDGDKKTVNQNGNQQPSDSKPPTKKPKSNTE